MMGSVSDVVAVALITGGVSAITGAIGAFTTYKVGQRNAETTIATVERQADVELEKVKAENERLRDQHREAERQNRQGTYHRMLAMFDRLDAWSRNPKATGKQFEALVEEFDFLHGGVLLFGDEDVIEALHPVVMLLNRIGGGHGPEEEETRVRLRAAYQHHRVELMQEQGAVINAMRTDLDRSLPRRSG
jgi:hypothetical protein